MRRCELYAYVKNNYNFINEPYKYNCKDNHYDDIRIAADPVHNRHDLYDLLHKID
jgi:hypothetical protein